LLLLLLLLLVRAHHHVLEPINKQLSWKARRGLLMLLRVVRRVEVRLMVGGRHTPSLVRRRGVHFPKKLWERKTTKTKNTITDETVDPTPKTKNQKMEAIFESLLVNQWKLERKEVQGFIKTYSLKSACDLVQKAETLDEFKELGFTNKPQAHILLSQRREIQKLGWWVGPIETIFVKYGHTWPEFNRMFSWYEVLVCTQKKNVWILVHGLVETSNKPYIAIQLLCELELSFQPVQPNSDGKKYALVYAMLKDPNLVGSFTSNDFVLDDDVAAQLDHWDLTLDNPSTELGSYDPSCGAIKDHPMYDENDLPGDVFRAGFKELGERMKGKEDITVGYYHDRTSFFRLQNHVVYEEPYYKLWRNVVANEVLGSFFLTNENEPPPSS
jgi:hypothetical protein